MSDILKGMLATALIVLWACTPVALGVVFFGGVWWMAYLVGAGAWCAFWCLVLWVAAVVVLFEYLDL